MPTSRSQQATLRIVAWLSFCACRGTAVAAQANSPALVLPEPSGTSGVGRVTRYWVDSSRAAFVDPSVAQRRELMVDIWYPTTRGARGEPASYLPLLPTLRRVASDSVLRRRFSPAYALMEAGRLTTHAIEGAPAHCRDGGCPFLVFSHGGGEDRSFYTAQFEELASHGYVVAAVAHTFDTHVVVFPDARVIRAAPQPRDTVPDDPTLPVWRRELAREQRSDAHLRRLATVEALDIRFVLDQLMNERGNGQLRSPLFRQLDLERAGALGHSLGGEAAAVACQLDRRLKACLNQDGAMHGRPFWRDAAGRTMSQPFMYFTRDNPRSQIPDSVLAQLQITRREMDSLSADIASGPERLLRDIPAGAYLVTLMIPAASHMAFSDEPLMQAVGDSSKAAALLALGAVNRYTRAFFDKTLLGQSGTPLDERRPSDSGVATVQIFRPKR